MTVPVTPGKSAACRAEADAFSRAAKGFLIPYPSDADNYRVLARVQFIAFKAHLCDTAILREAVAQRLTEKQLREVLRFFGFLGGTGESCCRPPSAERAFEALEHAGGRKSGAAHPTGGRAAAERPRGANLHRRADRASPPWSGVAQARSSRSDASCSLITLKYAQLPRCSRATRPASSSTRRWWLTVGCVSPSGSVR